MDEVKGIHIIPNGHGLGHNARQREIIEAIKTYCESQGTTFNPTVITEAKFIEFFNGIPVYRTVSPHDPVWFTQEQQYNVNSAVVKTLVDQINPNYVIMDTLPRGITQKPNDSVFKTLVLRPVNRDKYVGRSTIQENSWGGYDFVAIPSNEDSESLLDLDPEWETYINQMKTDGKHVEHVGRIIPFKSGLDEINADPETGIRMREKFGYDWSDQVVLLAFGGGLLTPGYSTQLETELSKLKETDLKLHLIAGPYADKEWVKKLRDENENMTVELNYMDPIAYAKRITAADFVVGPSGYNT
ncbi:MAG: UDP-N-acetylglucosamine--N-acetylmuramyl-(pentapeptide) pyrophosphoryl-undecaprenol N-acetylglucosamine transferase [Candidatus Altiarchaeota archaeon]|nr:UDP-N-acetylglucosamine--N-acetylmuramyl-(pentapeptide) pyrophosphoryl-undecaprenol N-acetylglucosamine transferase [Candidatus Altiarchaeota archaeon]